MEDQLIIGQIVKAHGLRGEVKVRSYTDDPERFKGLRECSLEDQAGQIIGQLKIRKVRSTGREVIISFYEHSDRESVEKLRQLYLSVPRSKAQKLGPSSWYVCDLIGLRVWNGQTDLGSVKEVLTTGHQDLLRVADPGLTDLYIPLVKDWLEDVDLSQGKIVFRLPDGFVEELRK